MTTGRINQVTSPYYRLGLHAQQAPSREHVTHKHQAWFYSMTFTKPINPIMHHSKCIMGSQQAACNTHIHAQHTTIPSYFSGLACVFLRYSNNTIKIAVLYQSIQGHIHLYKHTFREGSEPNRTHLVCYDNIQAAHWPGLLRIGLHTDTHSVTTQTIHAAVTRYNNL